MPKLESYSQYNRRLRREQIRRVGAREGIEALLSVLMRQLPVATPGDLLDAADLAKRQFEPLTDARMD